MKTLTTTNSTFKKSLLSFLVISALTGSFISWDNYLPDVDNEAVKATFTDRNASLESILTANVTPVDSDALAIIAQENLTSELDAEVDAQTELQAETFIAQSLSEDHESGESDNEFIAAIRVEEELSSEALLLQEDGEDQQQTEATTASAPLVDEVTDGEESLFILVSPLLFAFDSSEICPSYYEALNDSALFIQDEAKTADTIWQIVGYTDLSGDQLYNSKLAKKRAQKVAAYLVDKGVDEAQLSVLSLGASNPLNSERSIENNRHERRVEIHRYQAEITALAEQSQKQMQRLRADKKAQQERALVAKQALPQQTPAVEEVSPSKLAETPQEETVIEKEQIKRLTTAMEL